MFTTPVPANYICLWYKAGDLNRQPYTAIVTKSDEYGMLSLTCFGERLAVHKCVTGVRHRSDPFLVDRPQHAKDNGCWDYLPGMAPEPPKPEKPAPAPLSNDAKAMIAELAAKGKNAPEIAAALTEHFSEPWSHQRMNAILRNTE